MDADIKEIDGHVYKLARLSFSVLSAARPNNYLIFLLVALLLSATALTILGDAYIYLHTYAYCCNSKVIDVIFPVLWLASRYYNTEFPRGFLQT